MGGIDGKVEDTACTVRAIGMEAHSGGRTACLITANASSMAEPATRIVADVSKGMPYAQARPTTIAPSHTPTKKTAGILSAPISANSTSNRGRPSASKGGQNHHTSSTHR